MRKRESEAGLLEECSEVAAMGGLLPQHGRTGENALRDAGRPPASQLMAVQGLRLK
jgi:hypothetical protein